MKILITGAAGHIGAECLANFKSKKMEIIGLDNFSNYYSALYKKARVNALGVGDLIRTIDIEDRIQLEKFFIEQRPDIVIHLAARPGVRTNLEDSIYYEKTNYYGFRNMVEYSKKYKVKKFFYASSSSVYGEKSNRPFDEENSILAPKSYYALSKLANEKIAELAADRHTTFVGLRFFTVYGRWPRPDMAIMKFSTSALFDEKAPLYGSLNNQRDFTHVTDVSRVICELIDVDYNKHNDIFNICGSKPYSLEQLVSQLRNNGIPVDLENYPINPLDMQITHGQNTKLTKFDINPPDTSLETGIKDFSNWIRQIPRENLKNWL